MNVESNFERALKKPMYMNKPESLQFFLQNSGSVYYITTDLQGNYQYINELFRVVFENQSTNISDKSFIERIHPDDVDLYKQTVEECISTHHKITSIDLRNTRPDGSVFTTRWEFSGMFDSKNQPIGIQYIGTDITERLRSERALLESNQRWTFALEGSNVGLWDWNMVTNKIFFSRGFSKILGYEQHEISDDISEWESRIHPEDKPNVYVDIDKHLKATDPYYENMYRMRRKDGTYIWIMGRGLIMGTDNEGKPNRMIGTHTDITDVKAAEEKYRLLFQSNPLPMWIYDIETLKFLEVNEAAINHYGYSAEEFENITIKDIRPAEEIPGFMKRIEVVKQNPGTKFSDGTWRHKKKDGQIIHVEIKSHDIIYNGRIARLVLANDITQKFMAEEKLRQSNERFALAGKATSDAIWDADLISNSVSWGEGFEKLFGYKIRYCPDGQSWTNNIHSQDRERVLNSHKKVLSDAAETFWRDEYRFIRANGSIAHVVDKGVIMRDENGLPIRMVGAMQDITAIKEAEVKLMKERYLLRTLIDHLPDYIYVKDAHSRHIINNKANVKLMGAKVEEETLGKTVLDYFDKDIAQIYIESDQQVLQSGKAINNQEEQIVSHNNKKKWLLTTKIPLKDEHEKVFGLVGISRDITEQKEIAESLRMSNERFNIVSKATNDAIWDWDLTTNAVLWNKGVKNLFGYKGGQIGRFKDWWVNNIHPDDKERVVSAIYSQINKGLENWHDEYRFVCADGTYKYVLDRGFILFNEDRKPYRMIGAMMDVTERRKLEAELAQQKVNQQRNITEATIQAQEKERTELGKELHDNINQILSTTKLYIDMAITEKEIREELLQKTYTNITAAIEEIRMLSRSLVPPSLGDIGLTEAITELVEDLNLTQKLQFKLRSADLEKYHIPDNIKLMVYRIVQEQLNNIIKHSKATKAEIKLAVSKKNLNITVRDNGVGFEVNKKTKGIGLNNIASRAELHNGKIDIISFPGKGCNLKVSIPI